MNNEIQTIIKRMETVINGEPWFGRSVFSILADIDPKKVHNKPGNNGHTLLELLYHMNTWCDFTLKRIERDKIKDLAAAEALDWRTIDPKIHTWKKAVAEFKTIHKNIIALLAKKDDDFLLEMVDYRKYNFRFLLNGMIDHTIYHLGQLAYVNKLLG